MHPRLSELFATRFGHAPAAVEPWGAALVAAGLDLQARPEQIPTALWQQLDRLTA